MTEGLGTAANHSSKWQKSSVSVVHSLHATENN